MLIYCFQSYDRTSVNINVLTSGDTDGDSPFTILDIQYGGAIYNSEPAYDQQLGFNLRKGLVYMVGDLIQFAQAADIGLYQVDTMTGIAKTLNGSNVYYQAGLLGVSNLITDVITNP